MKKLYIRKVFEHDTTHEVSITKYIVNSFFNNQLEFQIKGKLTSEEGTVYIRSATDPRLGGDFKRILSKEGDIEIDDLIVFYGKHADDQRYEIELIKKDATDRRYVSFFELFHNKNRHVTIDIEDSIDEIDSFEEPKDIESPTVDHIETSKKRDDTIQQIHFGAPGTGKSYGLSQIIGESYPGYKDTDENPYVIRTTLHSEYSYFDFIGSVLPYSDADKIDYRFNPGPLTVALDRALSNPSYDVYLVIEEMSRGNIAAVFGDVFQLLDRNEEGRSEYAVDNTLIRDYLVGSMSEYTGEIRKIYLPSNLHILGTVNTSDQNVNVLDTAFKRRFGFVYQSVSPVTQDGIFLNQYKIQFKDLMIDWNEFYQLINYFILNNLELSEDKQMGQFFVKFSQINSSIDNEITIQQKKSKNFKQLKNKVLHYLWEDVQAVAINDQRIFNDKFKSFVNLYEAFNENISVEHIFSTEFVKVLKDRMNLL